MRARLIAVAVCLTLTAAGCGDDGSVEDGGDTAAQSGAEATKRGKPSVQVPDGEPPAELLEEDLIEGTGPAAKSGDQVTVNYVGVGYDSRKEFDTSWGGEPFAFQLGAGEVIQGWDKGIEGMKVGGRRELTIPSGLAYGQEGFPPAIGRNEALVFVVDLLDAS